MGSSSSFDFNDFNDLRYRFTEHYFYALANKAGGVDTLLAMTRGKPRGQVEFIVDSFFPEEEANSGLLARACQYLLDRDTLMDGLEALPWRDEDS